MSWPEIEDYLWYPLNILVNKIECHSVTLPKTECNQDHPNLIKLHKPLEMCHKVSDSSYLVRNSIDGI